MLAKFSVEQALMKARSHVKNEEIEEAKRLYQAILMDFPKNIRAQKELASLNNHLKNNIVNSIPSNTINQLINMYNQGQLTTVVELAQSLVIQHPQAFVVWNILGAANIGLGQVEKASEAFKKVTDLNPNYADGFNNLGITLKDQGKLDKAIEAFNRALSIKPDYAVTYFNIGVVLMKKGKLDEAIEAYNKALTLKPNYPEAYYNMGASLKDQGNLDKAIEAYNKAITLNPNYAEAYNNLGNALVDQNELDLGIKAYKRALKLKPDYVEAFFNIGITLQKQGKLEEAVEKFRKVLSIDPNHPQSYGNIGIIFRDQGKFDQAIESFKKALSLKPNNPDAYNNLGLTLNDLNKLDEAIEAYNKALLLESNYTDALNNMGVTLQNQGKLSEAIETYKKALSINPDYAEVYNNMGLTLQNLGESDEAIKSYNKALEIKPDFADAYNNLGFTLQNLNKLEEAIDAYHKVLAINHSSAETYNNIGAIFRDQGKLDKAVEVYNKAILLKPDYIEAFYNLGNIFVDQGKLDQGIKVYNKALSINHNYDLARAHKLHQQAHICDWNSLDEDKKLINTLGTKDKPVPPFTMLSLEDDPKHHYLRSKKYVEEKFIQKQLTKLKTPSRKSKHINIGYFSADFHDHATMWLILKVLAIHDRQKFKIYAYSYGPEKKDYIRQKLIESVDVFKNVQKMSDEDIALLGQKDEIDIAVDLKGHTKNQRLGIFSYRPAPIQITYLGYPGSTGANFIDYIIADPIVIPKNQLDSYSEKIIYLPNSYQPNNNTRAIANTSKKRKDLGLPEKGFIFCCFNNNYKISSVEFNIWMRLLKKVKGSVLWLLKSNRWAQGNLQKEAEKRGVKRSCLIFADKLPHEEHLARHKHADLFLDTFNVNAHTTASDALWAGLPVVTKLGNSFASRVSGSLLNAIGLPELITDNENDYETLILELATNTNKLKRIKNKLANNRLVEPLFDTEKFTKHLEKGYEEAWYNYYESNDFKNIFVDKITEK